MILGSMSCFKSLTVLTTTCRVEACWVKAVLPHLVELDLSKAPSHIVWSPLAGLRRLRAGVDMMAWHRGISFLVITPLICCPLDDMTTTMTTPKNLKDLEFVALAPRPISLHQDASILP